MHVSSLFSTHCFHGYYCFPLAILFQREAELGDELMRQKEKERLRKEYIEELKKRHEEVSASPAPCLWVSSKID